jgi:hypothetical protein
VQVQPAATDVVTGGAAGRAGRVRKPVYENLAADVFQIDDSGDENDGAGARHRKKQGKPKVRPHSLTVMPCMHVTVLHRGS